MNRPISSSRLGVGGAPPVPTQTVRWSGPSAAAVMLGYFRDPEATVEAFTPDGWFRTATSR